MNQGETMTYKDVEGFENKFFTEGSFKPTEQFQGVACKTSKVNLCQDCGDGTPGNCCVDCICPDCHCGK